MPQKKTQTTKKELQKGVIVAKVAANFRKQPSLTGDKVFEAPIRRGTIVEIMSRKDVDGELWYRVKYNGKIGYVLGSLIKLN